MKYSLTLVAVILAISLSASTAKAQGHPFASPTTDDGALLTVLDGDRGQLVPWAVVRVLDLDAFDRKGEGPEVDEPWDLQALMVRFGRPFRCDQQGQLRLPRAKKLLVTAVAPDTFGATVVGEEEAARLTLRPERRLSVAVVGADGQPQSGYPVLFDLLHEMPDAPAWSRFQAISRGPRGAATIQRLPDADTLRALLCDSAGRSVSTRAATVRISIAGIFLDPVVGLADRARAEREPMTLVLPPMAQLLVEVRGANGRPFTDFCRLWIEDDINRFPVPGYLTRTGMMLLRLPLDERTFRVFARDLSFEWAAASATVELSAFNQDRLVLNFDRLQPWVEFEPITATGQLSTTALELSFDFVEDGRHQTITSSEWQWTKSGRVRVPIPDAVIGRSDANLSVRKLVAGSRSTELRLGFVGPDFRESLGSLRLDD